MTATAVVTGSAARVDDVTQAFERRGVTVLGIDRGADVAPAASVLEAGSVAYYVQLPGDVPSPSTSRTNALAALFGQGLIPRFGEVEQLLPKLAAVCAVVLVTGEIVDDLSSLDYPHAPTCLLEMLAETIEADLVPSVARVTVVSHRHSADQIADIALASGPERAASMAGYASLAPDMSYDDWRLACLSRSGPEA